MPIWSCDFDGCDGPAVREQGDCTLCNRHICALNLQPNFHSCPKWEDVKAYDWAEILAKIDTKALAERATSLRDGMPCTKPPVPHTPETDTVFMGGMNYHIEIHFEDGVVWLARIRHKILQSEFATLRFLEQTSVPAPKFFDIALQGDNSMPGKSLCWHDATPAQKRKIMNQLAGHAIELRKYPFDSIGSLDQPGTSRVGEFAREVYTDFDKTGLQALGPFSRLKDYYEAFLRQPVDAYLIHRFLLDLVPKVLPEDNGDDKFFLKHVDDKGDHIFIDDDFKITGVIDWEWAHVMPKAIAFNSPMVLMPLAFAQMLEERDSPILAQCVRKGKLQHQFAFCCSFDLARDWDGFLGIFRGLLAALGIYGSFDWSR
ncbi:hypothetical protein IWZ03DRAFT_401420 [Phyllosticta citriasiana]|uniref:Aminoglycoside phosphotransferase domain-containing protein n=1 Tax=Phyllosticta citriasiana TaxID=595635 RepID=A0ABR1KEK5_9PEZI